MDLFFFLLIVLNFNTNFILVINNSLQIIIIHNLLVKKIRGKCTKNTIAIALQNFKRLILFIKKVILNFSPNKAHKYNRMVVQR